MGQETLGGTMLLFEKKLNQMVKTLKGVFSSKVQASGMYKMRKLEELKHSPCCYTILQ